MPPGGLALLNGGGNPARKRRSWNPLESSDWRCCRRANFIPSTLILLDWERFFERRHRKERAVWSLASAGARLMMRASDWRARSDGNLKIHREPRSKIGLAWR